MNDSDVSPLRVGIVGAGSWARQAHLPGYLTCPTVEVVAVCDLDRTRAEHLACETAIPGVYASAAEMLAHERLDLVSVVTPDDCHRADATAALAAGAHVLCEKPLAVTLADAQALAAAAAHAGVLTKMGFTLRYAPPVLRVRELVQSGAIGEPQLLQATQQNGQFLDPATPFHWKMDRARTGGGAIVEYGVHTLDLARWLMGEATRVCATSRTWVPERQLPNQSGTVPVAVDDSTAWLMEFAGGAIAICHAGWATAGRPPGLELRLSGSGGTLHCLLTDDLPDDQSLRLAGPDGRLQPVAIPPDLTPVTVPPGPWWRRWPAHLIHRFVAEIRTSEAVAPTFADGLRAQVLLDAVQTSLHEQRWVDVPSDSNETFDPDQGEPRPVTQS